ncbi:aminodeoxychorismate lyase [Marinomonas rhizomae]|uniref:Aminodeoxychorismate lyase n=1 Tax=Marinomonas rhizomae TaxID=491948 RepID=A0A366JD84_9GAMM|nr:aminodeoxychorismate lyase [Marinomonas rhizomae]RBP84787.1 4-amino-4-deoxychorismate lyase [Marinomonas rhizomae]RNF75016.1 aminodeoxychorismate lyase [Marinomonas rhizomae]
MTWFVNYRLDHSVSVADRSLAYGDGVFETIRVFPRHFLQINDHLSRLYRGLSKLAMPFSLEQKSSLYNFLHSNVLPLIDEESVVKIIVSRGEGGRGYLAPENCIHSVIIGILPAPNYQLHREKGVSLSISPVPVSSNRFLAGMKHLNRLENVIAKQFLSSADFEAIMMNGDGELVECIQSNLFWYKQGVLYTPSLELSGVQGTYRKAIIQNQYDYTVQVGHFLLSDLMSADEVFITNSLMGIVPVTGISGVSFPIGVHTRKLQILMQAKDVHGAH